MMCNLFLNITKTSHFIRCQTASLPVLFFFFLNLDRFCCDQFDRPLLNLDDCSRGWCVIFLFLSLSLPLKSADPPMTRRGVKNFTKEWRKKHNVWVTAGTRLSIHLSLSYTQTHTLCSPSLLFGDQRAFLCQRGAFFLNINYFPSFKFTWVCTIERLCCQSSIGAALSFEAYVQKQVTVSLQDKN